MWRTLATDPHDVATARLTSYRYYPGQPKDHGDDITFKYVSIPGKPIVKISSGRSYRVSQYIKLNDPGMIPSLV